VFSFNSGCSCGGVKDIRMPLSEPTVSESVSSMTAVDRIRGSGLSVPSLLLAAFVIGLVCGLLLGRAEAQSVTRVFDSNTGVVLNYITADQASEFELVMERVGLALRSSENADRRRQAAAWKVYKATESLDTGVVLYVSIVDPVVPGSDYWVPQILNEAFSPEVQELYEAYTGTFADGQIYLNLSLVMGL